MTKLRLQLLRERMETEVRDGILPFWSRHAPDRVHGGFIGAIRIPHQPVPDAPRSLVLNARLLWTFSAAHRILGGTDWRPLADEAYRYLMQHFRDAVHGGMFWMLDSMGQPIDRKKQTYGQAFAIYGLSEYFRATGHVEARKEAMALFELLDLHVHDRECLGYLEACNEDWSPLSDMTLSSKEMNVPKTMNTHLHVLESLTNLLRLKDDETLRVRHRETLLILADKIFDAAEDRFQLYFDMDWKPLSDITSFGHDIEGSWLLYEAAEVTGDTELEKTMRDLSVRMARRACATGLDPLHGGMYDEIHGGILLDRKVWWVQAEALVGMTNACQLTGEEDWLQSVLDTWLFADAHLVDHTYGEWFGASGVAGGRNDVHSSEDEQKTGPWKCSYHNARMCFEMMHRLDAIMEKKA